MFRLISMTALSRNTSPRVQLFFIANLIKLFVFITSGLASALSSQVLAVDTSIILILWLGIMMAITIPQTDIVLVTIERQLKPVFKFSVVILAICISVEVLAVSAIIGYSAISHNELHPIAQPVVKAFKQEYDSSVLTIQAAEHLLSGKNPYAHANIITAFDASPEAYTKLTPLRTGAFADSFPYPDQKELQNVWHAAITNPDVIPPEIESRVNYPAGSFLLLAPFVALGISDMRIILIIFTIPAIIYAARRIPPGQRWIFVLGVLLSFELFNLIFTFDSKVLCLPFMLAGWLMAPRRPWLSAILMGIAAATKQTAWFLLPFYIILMWRTTGIRPAIRSAITVGAVFLIINAPFIIIDPHLWLSSVMAPMTASLFPLGNGLISLVSSGIIHLDSPIIFTSLEVIALIGCLLWYVRYASRYPHAGLILAIIPLFFAWRSMLSYFCLMDIILLASILTPKLSTHSVTEAV